MKFAFLLCLTLSVASCGINKQRISLNDYFIHPTGKNLNSKQLHAFIFENNLKNIPFQDYIATKYNTKNQINKSIQITTNDIALTLIFYDFDDFEKHFGSQNFEQKTVETASEKIGNTNKFLAISVLSQTGEDCLDPNSLLQTIAIKYLNSLKNQYLSNNGQQ